MRKTKDEEELSKLRNALKQAFDRFKVCRSRRNSASSIGMYMSLSGGIPDSHRKGSPHPSHNCRHHPHNRKHHSHNRRDWCVVAVGVNDDVQCSHSTLKTHCEVLSQYLLRGTTRAILPMAV
jgi:hypothetical protein